MELSKKDIAQYITMIRLNFENAYPTRDDDELTLLIGSWYSILKDYPKEVCNEAVMQTLKRAKFAPRIGDVVETIDKMQSAFQKTDTELWAELTSVLGKTRTAVYDIRYLNGCQNARERLKGIFDGLSQELKNYVRNTSGLIDIADYDDDQLSYEKGRFLRIMPSLREREKTRKELPESVAKLVGGVADKLQIENKKGST